MYKNVTFSFTTFVEICKEQNGNRIHRHVLHLQEVKIKIPLR